MRVQGRLRNGVVATVLTCAIGVTPALGQGRGQGRGSGPDKTTGQGAKSGPDAVVVVKFGFSAHDREVITSFYTTHPSGLPPGLAKRGGDLPPGLEKQLRRDGALPPGLEKKLEPLPVALERQLSKLPADYRRVVLGAHLVVVNRQTNLVVDFMLNVVR
jgi:hypothetical protein